MWLISSETLWKRRKEMICHSTGYEFCRAAALRPVSKSSLQYMPLHFQWTKIIFSLQKVDKSFVHGGFSYCRVPVFWFTLILSQTISPFSPSDLPAVIPSKLVFTSLHCSISSWPLKGLRSDKPSNKHDSNRYQPKAYLIYNQRSDQTRSAARVNKNFDWCTDRYLINTTGTHQKEAAFLRERRFTKSWCLRASVSFSLLPLPSPIVPIFFSHPNFLDELSRKRLLRRLFVVRQHFLRYFE